MVQFPCQDANKGTARTQKQKEENKSSKAKYFKKTLKSRPRFKMMA